MECGRLGGQRADRAEIDDVALQLGGQRAFEVAGDLHVLAAADGAELRNAGDFGDEADAARALDAAVHRRLDQDAEVFVLDGALVFGEARRVGAVAHRLVLQIAFAALVADRTIERMVDQQKLEHALARLAHHRRIGLDHRRLAVGAGAQVLDRHRAGGGRLGRPALNLDQAHAAIAGDRQALVEAEARHFGARRLARLQQRVFRRNVELFAVDDDLAHAAFSRLPPRLACSEKPAGESPRDAQRRPAPATPTVFIIVRNSHCEGRAADSPRAASLPPSRARRRRSKGTPGSAK